MKFISQAVGNSAANIKADVITVQTLLNVSIPLLMPCIRLKTDGLCGPVTVGLIKEFQSRVMKIARPDGRVDPGQATMKKLNEVFADAQLRKEKTDPSRLTHLILQVQSFLAGFSPDSNVVEGEAKPSLLTDEDFKKAASTLGVEVAAIKAVAKVESLGGGFLSNGKPKILFEGHWFSKLTKGVHDSTHGTISYKKWTKKHYKGGINEYSRYNAAYALDKTAAMKSTSWGKFQIMGFNHKKAGYDTVDSFVKDMHVSEGKQLMAFVNFLKSTKLDVHLKSKNWAEFAKGYNGPKYKENKYDTRLQQAYEAFLPSISLH